MTSRIRLSSKSFKIIAATLAIALTCLAVPPQESSGEKNGSAPPVPLAGNEQAIPKPATPPAASVVSIPAPDVSAKGPAVENVRSETAKPGDKPLAPEHGVPGDFKIGAGDVLHIGVFHEPDASVQNVVVRTDGRISMPLLKEVSVAGLTPTELELKITEGLSKFLTAPDVTVVVSAINSKKIYIIGAVRKEGTLSLTYPMNVLQALAEAGGITDFAKRKKIYVLRNKDGKEIRLPFDYDAALKGEHMERNVPLIAGDTIVVPGG